MKKQNFTFSSIGTVFMLTILIMLFGGRASAQTWTTAGSAGFSAGATDYTAMALNASGTPYVAYQDSANGNKATVMMYNGSSWVTVGSAGFSAGAAQSVSIAIDASGTPYVAYEDASTSPANKATVMKYNGSSWVTVGSVGFSAGVAGAISMAINAGGTPYVAYTDAGNGLKATVMMYNGTSWVLVGSAGFSANNVDYTSIAINASGTPYVVYEDFFNSHKATVMMYNGTSWTLVGGAGFSAGQAGYTSIAINAGGTPYVAYEDYSAGPGDKATVMTYNGTSWVTVGSVGFSANTALHTSIAINPSGTPFVAYEDVGNGNKATVKRFNGTTWSTVGTVGFSAGAAQFTSITINGNGMPYVAYQDAANSNKATVMDFPCTPTVSVTSSPTNYTICSGSEASVTASLTVGGAAASGTYAWTPTTGVTPVAGAPTEVNIAPSATTSYTVTGTTSIGCTSTDAFTITVDLPPTGLTPPSAVTQSASPGACGAIVYYSPATLTYVGSPAATIEYTSLPLGAGSSLASGTTFTDGAHTVYLTTDGSNTCASLTNSFEVNVTPNTLSGSTTEADATCNGYGNGSITATVSGGSGNYQFVLTDDNGDTFGPVSVSGTDPVSYTFTGLYATDEGLGDYYITVTDNNCAQTNSYSESYIVVNEPDAIAFTSAISETDATCNGYSNGRIYTDGIVTGGNGTYYYTWTPSVPGTGGNDPIDVAAGTYSVSVTDGNSCPAATGSVTINQPDAIVVYSISETDATCNGYSNGSITTSVSGGNGTYTYTWTPSVGSSGGGAEGGGGGGGGAEPGAPADPTGLAAGPYSVSVTDGNGCPAGTNSITVNQPAAIVVYSISETDATCNGYSTGSISTSVSGGNGSYTYTWTPSAGSGGANPTYVLAGTYGVSVTDGNSCPAGTNSVIVGQPDPIEVDGYSTIYPTCHGYSNGSISTSVIGGDGTYTYTWRPLVPGTGGANPADVAAGTYNLSVTDSHGCPAGTSLVTEGQPDAITVTSISATEPTCHGYSNGSISTTVTGGNGVYPYIYTWTPSAGTGEANPTGVSAGSYGVSVTDGNGCPAGTNSILVNQPSQVVATATITQALCHGGAASVLVTAIGGTGVGTYSGTGTFSLTDGTSNTYSVTDGNTCAATSNSVSASSPSQVVATATITQALCHGGAASVLVTATGGTGVGTYSGTGTFSLTDGTSNTYSVTDGNTCAATSNSVSASSPSQVVATATITQALCHGGAASVLVTATGGTGVGTYSGTGTFSLADGTSNTYSVTDGNTCAATSNLVSAGSPSQVVATATITQALCHGGAASVLVTATGGTGVGTYAGTGTFSLADGTSNSYSVTDGHSCPATSNPVSASSPSQVLATATITQALCHGGAASVLVTATGGTGAGTYSGTGTFSLADGTTHSYLVTDGNTCPAPSNPVTASSPSQVVAIATITQALCHGGAASVLVTATGGTGVGTYLGTGTFSLTDGTSNAYSVTDGHSCPATSNSVTASSPAAITVTAGNVSVCVGSTVTLPGSPSGGTWSVADAYSNATAGTYSYTYSYTNASGCTGSATSTITVNALPSVGISSSNNLTCTATSATLTASGATNYTWSGSTATSSTRTVTAAGTYTVTGTSSGCSAAATYTETLTTTPLATPTVTVTNNCGSSTLTAAGIVAGAAVTWTPSGSGNPLTVTTSGSYTATQALSGCTSSASAAVTATPGSGLTLIPSIINVSCHGGSTGSISVAASGGSGTYTYSWSPCGGSTNSINGKAAGTYTVTVTNGECHATGVYTISQPSAALAVSGTITNETCNGGDNGKITTTVIGGTPAYSYLWSPGGATASSLSGKTAGTYEVTVTDGHGCTTSGSYIITQPAAITCAITVTPSTSTYTGGVPTNFYLGYGPQSATCNATCSASGCTYSWSSSSGTSCLSNSHISNPVYSCSYAGSYNYICTATNSSGCTTTQTVNVCVVDCQDHSHSGNILVCHGSGCSPTTVSCSSGSVPTYITPSYCPSNHLGSVGSGCSETGGRESGEEGSNAVISELTVNAYPNPFNSEVNVKIQSNLADNVDVIVYDVTGRVMETKPGQSVESVISLGQNLVAGIYFIEVNQGGVVKKVKVVKY